MLAQDVVGFVHGAVGQLFAAKFIFPGFPGVALRKFCQRHLASADVFERVLLPKIIARAVDDVADNLDGEMLGVGVESTAQAEHTASEFIVHHHLGVTAHHAGFHFAYAREFVRASEGRDSGVESALEGILRVERVRIGGESIHVDGEPVIMSELDRASGRHAQFDAGPNQTGARFEHPQPSAIDVARAWINNLR